MPSLRSILWSPITFIYSSVVRGRNWLFDNGYYKSIQFDLPVINVGNLSYGGTGKTPHIEYLIKLITPHFHVATLSRGYMRKTKGYFAATSKTTPEQVGDEPQLIKWKYPQVGVSVGEDRVMAVPQLLADWPATEVLLLDDAFQHRAIDPGLNILLTDYNNLYTRDELIPAGSLREPIGGAERAQFIVVTKCPPSITPLQKEAIRKELKPLPSQKLFFSYLQYGPAYYLLNPEQKLSQGPDMEIIMLAGIANPQPLEEYLTPRFKKVHALEYPDHHAYTANDAEAIVTGFNNLESTQKAIITTEKDAVRLHTYRQWFIERKIPIFVQPMQVEFFAEDKALFDREILNYLSRLRDLKNPPILQP
ncbi:tetraacyldisaccharide 4'-kinase [soil metagenome]